MAQPQIDDLGYLVDKAGPPEQPESPQWRVAVHKNVTGDRVAVVVTQGPAMTDDEVFAARSNLGDGPAQAIAALLGTEPGVPAGWDRIEGGIEATGWDDEPDPGAVEDRELERMDLDNAARALDLRERELALEEARQLHALVLHGDELRLAALSAAREVVAGHKYPSPGVQADNVERQYRRFLGLLEENGEPGA